MIMEPASQASKNAGIMVLRHEVMALARLLPVAEIRMHGLVGRGVVGLPVAVARAGCGGLDGGPLVLGCRGGLSSVSETDKLEKVQTRWADNGTVIERVESGGSDGTVGSGEYGL
jgi:hypothetical protein